MPYALDKSDTFPVSLASDSTKPEAERPAFIIAPVSAREWREIVKRQQAIEQEQDGIAALDSTLDSIRKHLVGWRNMRTRDAGLMELFGVEAGADGWADLPYKPELLDALIGLQEAQELAVKIISGNRLSVTEGNE